MPDRIAQLTGVPFSHVALDHENMDLARMEWAGAMIAEYKPQSFTVHLVTLDGARHKFGPDSPEPRATLELIDRGLKPMIEQARTVMPDLVVAIVSDHGFLPAGKGLNLARALAAEGLVSFDVDGKVADWKAYPWTMGGSAAIMLKDPADNAVAERVTRVLDTLAANPASGIDKVIDRQDIARLGGTSEGAYWVSMKSGYATVANSGKELVQDVASKGAHGYSPENDAMLATFIISGPGLDPKQLGIIDMRDVAPTIGEILEAPLPQYDGQVIQVAGERR